MKVSDYAQHDALGLAELVRAGEVSVKEVAVAATQAIEALNPTLNGVLEVFYDKLEEMDDTVKRGTDPGPVFEGVPMLLKDIGASEAGRKQEMGSLLCKGRVAKETSFLTEKFQTAGLKTLGRTALPEFGLASANTVSHMHGTTVNPWNPDYMSGSSSGGAGTSVASGMVPVAHASDIGGSTRHPAGICGAVGLKASRGRITQGPSRSDFPLGTLNEFAITRTVRDSAALLDAIEGPGHREARSIEKSAQGYLQAVLDVQAGAPILAGSNRLHVAMCDSSFCSVKVDQDVASCVVDTAKTLEGMGAVLGDDRPGFDFEMLCEADALAVGTHGVLRVHKVADEMGAPLDRTKISPILCKMMDAAESHTALDLYRALDHYNQIRRDVNLFFETYDLLVLPVISCQTDLAELHALEVSDMTSDRWMHHYQYLVPFNISGHPAVSVPVGMSRDGMPIGVQLVAKFGDESLLFRAAAALEIAMPWSGRIPPYHASRL